jgi:hypothetical protein
MFGTALNSENKVVVKTGQALVRYDRKVNGIFETVILGEKQ